MRRRPRRPARPWRPRQPPTTHTAPLPMAGSPAKSVGPSTRSRNPRPESSTVAYPGCHSAHPPLDDPRSAEKTCSVAFVVATASAALWGTCRRARRDALFSARAAPPARRPRPAQTPSAPPSVCCAHCVRARKSSLECCPARRGTAPVWSAGPRSPDLCGAAPLPASSRRWRSSVSTQWPSAPCASSSGWCARSSRWKDHLRRLPLAEFRARRRTPARLAAWTASRSDGERLPLWYAASTVV
ncbi:hypothetical protein FGB62_139g131 [Gracilaria domingensis]|nr:hypothetical protein FGB62_139g131 [Gracilaria domingensis]